MKYFLLIVGCLLPFTAIACIDKQPDLKVLVIKFIQPTIRVKEDFGVKEAKVLATLSIDKNGNVTAVKIKDYSPKELNESSLEKALSKAKYSGGPLNELTQEFSFELEKIEI